MTGYFYRDFRPAILSVTQSSLLFFRGVKLAPCCEAGRVAPDRLAVPNFLVRINVQPATYQGVLPFIKWIRAGSSLAGGRRIDIIGELT